MVFSHQYLQFSFACLVVIFYEPLWIEIVWLSKCPMIFHHFLKIDNKLVIFLYTISFKNKIFGCCMRYGAWNSTRKSLHFLNCRCTIDQSRGIVFLWEMILKFKVYITPEYQNSFMHLF